MRAEKRAAKKAPKLKREFLPMVKKTYVRRGNTIIQQCNAIVATEHKPRGDGSVESHPDCSVCRGSARNRTRDSAVQDGDVERNPGPPKVRAHPAKGKDHATSSSSGKPRGRKPKPERWVEKGVKDVSAAVSKAINAELADAKAKEQAADDVAKEAAKAQKEVERKALAIAEAKAMIARNLARDNTSVSDKTVMNLRANLMAMLVDQQDEIPGLISEGVTNHIYRMRCAQDLADSGTDDLLKLKFARKEFHAEMVRPKVKPRISLAPLSVIASLLMVLTMCFGGASLFFESEGLQYIALAAAAGAAFFLGIMLLVHMIRFLVGFFRFWWWLCMCLPPFRWVVHKYRPPKPPVSSGIVECFTFSECTAIYELINGRRVLRTTWEFFNRMKRHSENKFVLCFQVDGVSYETFYRWKDFHESRGDVLGAPPGRL